MRELPLHLPFLAITRLWTACFNDWEAYARKCFDAILSATYRTLIGLANEVFREFIHRPLYEHAM